MMSQKSKENIHNALFDRTETKLLVFYSKSRIYKVINWNPPEKEFDKKVCILLIIICLPLMVTKHINTEKVKS